MDFELTKEEIPIYGYTGFYVPIHPMLLDSSVRLDPTLANKVFHKSAKEWDKDLRNLLKTSRDLPYEKRESYRLYVNGKLGIKKENGNQTLTTISWGDQVFTDSRGFATGLSISRNFGGSLYFNPDDSNCTTGIGLNGEPNRFFNLSEEKASSLAHRQFGDYGQILVYAHHNIDDYPGALFLRNWALNYLNAAMKSI